MSSIELRAKSSDDLRTWLTGMWDGYRTDLIDAGHSREDAERNIERNRSQLLVGEDLADGQFVFDVWRGDDKVGTLWLGVRSGTDWWIYDIVIDQAFRGTGLGRPTLRAAEEYVRSRGGSRLGLNVFGPNAVARHLYDAAGYQVTSLQMTKDLTLSE
ncbi:MAG: GNAT family N-acetyltransferase [Acidimicrobiales bacterium]|jgi:GNAT superfamily N-acetyltransferase